MDNNQNKEEQRRGIVASFIFILKKLLFIKK